MRWWIFPGTFCSDNSEIFSERGLSALAAARCELASTALSKPLTNIESQIDGAKREKEQKNGATAGHA